MAKRSEYRPAAHSPEQAIMRALTPLTNQGFRPSQVFEDWVQWCDATLHEAYGDISVVARHAAHTQQRYGMDTAAVFLCALQALAAGLDAEPWRDILGRIYMNWASPNRYRGQFFTPEELARLMTSLTLLGAPAEIFARVRAACAAIPAAQAALTANRLDLDGLLTWDDDDAARFCLHVLPLAAPALAPIRSLEPCCGSGVLVLCQIAALPRWISQVGLIQYRAIDIDPLCAAMCRVQTGCLGVPVQVICANSLDADEIQRIAGTLPPVLFGAYVAAVVAHARGDSQAVSALVAAVNAGRAGAPDAEAQLMTLTATLELPDLMTATEETNNHVYDYS